MKEEIKKRESFKTVESLRGFPFDSFSKLKMLYLSREIDISVNREVSRNWTSQKTSTNLKVIFWSTLPIIVMLSFVVFIITTKSWLLLPLLFLFLIVYKLSFLIINLNRGSAFGAILIMLIFFIGIITTKLWLILFAVSVFFIYYSAKNWQLLMAKGLIEDSLDNELLFRKLWAKNDISIWLKNGNSYWGAWKKEGNNFFYYNFEESGELVIPIKNPLNKIEKLKIAPEKIIKVLGLVKVEIGLVCPARNSFFNQHLGS